MRRLRSTSVTLFLAVLATLAATRVDASRRVRVRWESYRTTSEFVDPRDAPAPSLVNAMTLVRLEQIPGPPVTLRGPIERELAEDRLLVEARDAGGTVRFQTVIPDPRVLRAEPGAENRLSGRLLHRARVEFDVIVPDDPAIVELRFYSNRWTGERWERALLGTVALAPPGGPPPPPPPPPSERTAWPVTTIVASGDPAHRLDLVILGDGYTSGQRAKYASDVTRVVKGIFAQPPFSAYRRYFNVHRVDVDSPQSGADHPSLGKFVDTALDASFDCGGIPQLVCVDSAGVNAVIQDSLPQAPADLKLVLVNDPEYGGAGGQIAVASTHPKAVELVLHETGHSFGSLADEYGGPPPPACVDDVEPAELNATRQSRATNAKWSRWIDADDRAECEGDGRPTMCKGARYCDSTLFRPTVRSKMRELGAPFHAVNGEQLVKRMYGRLSPIEGVSPEATTLKLAPGATQVFAVTTLRPSRHDLKIVWSLDGVAQATGPRFTFVAPAAAGPHTVSVTVEDPTDMVRNDPDGLLKASRDWELAVEATPP